MKLHYTRFGRGVIFVLSILIVIDLALLDDMISQGYSLSLFYTVPVVVVAFFVGRWPAVYIALFSAVMWLLVDLRTEPNVEPIVHLSNILLRIGFFFFVVQVIFYLSQLRERQKQIIEFVVHDLKTPLASIDIALNAIKEKVGGTPSGLEKLSRAAIASSNKLAVFINSLIDLSKIETQTYVANFERVDLRKLVDDTIESVRIWAEKASVKIDKKMEIRANVIYTDQSLIERTLMNLLSNALKVSPVDSTITIQVEEGLKKIIFSVADQGPGLSRRFKNRPFDKHYQIAAKRDGIEVGSGLGLTFCQFSIEQLGGRIWFDSVPGKGTTVTFTLPDKAS